MNKEVESKSVEKQPSKRKFWRNIWLISILGFIVSIPLAANFNVLGSLLFVPSVIVGILSFFIGTLKSSRGLIRFVINFFVVGGFCLFFLFLFTYFFMAAPSRIYGTSMEPTFKNKEFVLIDKFTYKLRSPKRDEVVDYIKNDEERIGRIIGLPNEAIQIKPGEVRIDDKVVNEPYADWSKWAENREQRIPLKNDEYLVLYDKRGGDIQTVKRENIVGRFFYRYWPSSVAGFIKY